MRVKISNAIGSPPGCGALEGMKQGHCGYCSSSHSIYGISNWKQKNRIASILSQLVLSIDDSTHINSDNTRINDERQFAIEPFKCACTLDDDDDGIRELCFFFLLSPSLSFVNMCR